MSQISYLFMDSQLRFPLFEELLQGSLSPLLPAMAADTDYNDRIESQIVNSLLDEGRYLICFREIHHVKQRYYRQLLISETFAYCNELTSLLDEESSPNIRTYYRDAILDKHLTSCLMRLAKEIDASDLNHTLDELLKQSADIDKICNSYVLQLLKVCLTKAYLEVQDCLADVVRNKLSEKELYSSLLNELPPVKTYLKLRTERQTKSPIKPSTTVHTAPTNVATPIVPIVPTTFISDEKFLSVKEIGEKTNWDERTIRRYLKDGKLKGSKPGGSWIVAQSDFDIFYNTYKNQ